MKNENNTMPNSVNELMSMAAEALDEVDVERLQNLRDHIRGWMQTDEEMIAQFEMLDAMSEAAGILEEAQWEEDREDTVSNL